MALNAFVLWPVIGEQLTAGATAQLIIVLAFAGLISPLLSLGSHMHLLRRAGSDREQKAVAHTLLAGIALICGFGLVISIGSPIGSFLHVGASTAAFLVAQSSLRGQRRAFRFALLTAGCQSGAVAFAAMAAQWSGLQGMCLAYTASTWLLVAATVLPSRHFAGRTLITQALSFGSPLVPGLILYLMIPQGSRLLVGTLGSERDLLIFQYAGLVALGGMTLVTSISGHYGAASLGAASSKSCEYHMQEMRRMLVGIVFLLAVAIPAFVVLFGRMWLPETLSYATWRWVVIAMLPIVPLQALSDLLEYRVLIRGRTGALLLPAISGALAGGIGFAATDIATHAYWAGVVAVIAAVIGRLGALIFVSRESELL